MYDTKYYKNSNIILYYFWKNIIIERQAVCRKMVKNVN